MGLTTLTERCWAPLLEKPPGRFSWQMFCRTGNSFFWAVHDGKPGWTLATRQGAVGTHAAGLTLQLVCALQCALQTCKHFEVSRPGTVHASDTVSWCAVVCFHAHSARLSTWACNKLLVAWTSTALVALSSGMRVIRQCPASCRDQPQMWDHGKAAVLVVDSSNC